MERQKDFSEIERKIDAASLEAQFKVAKTRPDDFSREHPGTSANSLYIKAEVFVAIEEICRLIAEGTSWDKKSRVILEYDPMQEKFTIGAVMHEEE